MIDYAKAAKEIKQRINMSIKSGYKPYDNKLLQLISYYGWMLIPNTWNKYKSKKINQSYKNLCNDALKELKEVI